MYVVSTSEQEDVKAVEEAGVPDRNEAVLGRGRGQRCAISWAHIWVPRVVAPVAGASAMVDGAAVASLSSPHLCVAPMVHPCRHR